MSNTPDHKERAHAKLSPSSMKRITECPGSFALYEDIKPTESTNEHAELGTKAHEICETALITNKTAAEVIDDAEMARYCQEYVDYCLEVARRNGGHMVVEQRLDLRGFLPESFGTADFVSVDFKNGWIDVVDLKYGIGKVYPKDNVQLLCYGIGAVDYYKDQMKDFKGLRVHIGQPRLDHFDHWEVNAIDVAAWKAYITERALLAWKITYEFKEGDHCHWCKVKSYCPAKAKSASTALLKGMTYKKSDLPQMLELADKVDEWVKAVRAEAAKFAEEGGLIEGYGYKSGRKSRQWKNTDEIVDKVKACADKLTEEDLYVKELKSVAQLEKVLTNVYNKTFAKEVLEQLTETTEGKSTFGKIKEKK